MNPLRQLILDRTLTEKDVVTYREYINGISPTPNRLQLPMHCVAEAPAPALWMEWLLKHGGDSARNVLHTVCIYKGPEQVRKSQLLLDAKVDINEQDKTDSTALLTACVFGSDMVSFLLQRGADPNLLDGYNNSALFFAIQNRDVDAVKLLLQYGANVNQTIQKATHLHYAVHYWGDCPALTQILLTHRADVHATTADGETVLHWAKNTIDCAQVCDILVSEGVDPFVRSFKGQTAMDEANHPHTRLFFQLLYHEGYWAVLGRYWLRHCMPHPLSETQLLPALIAFLFSSRQAENLGALSRYNFF